MKVYTRIENQIVEITKNSTTFHKVKEEWIFAPATPEENKLIEKFAKKVLKMKEV